MKYKVIVILSLVVFALSSCEKEFKWEQKSPDASTSVEVTANRKVALDPFRTQVLVKNIAGAQISFEFEWTINKPSNDQILLQWTTDKDGVLTFTFTDKATKKFMIKGGDHLEIITLN